MQRFITALIISTAALAGTANAQTANDPAIAACNATGLIALHESSPTLKSINFDMESLAVSKANTKIGDIAVRTVIMGDAYFEKKEAGKAHRFVCLLGDKGKVLLTFFTSQ